MHYDTSYKKFIKLNYIFIFIKKKQNKTINLIKMKKKLKVMNFYTSYKKIIIFSSILYFY